MEKNIYIKKCFRLLDRRCLLLLWKVDCTCSLQFIRHIFIRSHHPLEHSRTFPLQHIFSGVEGEFASKARQPQLQFELSWAHKYLKVSVHLPGPRERTCFSVIRRSSLSSPPTNYCLALTVRLLQPRRPSCRQHAAGGRNTTVGCISSTGQIYTSAPD